MIRVYTASKIASASLWRDLSSQWPGVLFIARWLRHAEIGTPDLPEYAERFWREDEQDIRDCDAVLVYAWGNVHLRGALVEAGMGIAFGKTVIVVGAHPDYGTWQFHPRVVRVPDLGAAYELLCRIDTMSQLSHQNQLGGPR